MLSFMISENILTICSALSLVAEVYSQTTSDDSQQRNRYRSCSASSYCIPIGRCPTLPGGWRRRGVGITCGVGIGRYRMVCCPRGNGQEVRQAWRQTTTTPLPPSDCGVSQGIDWFQEHSNDTDETEATWPWVVAIARRDSTGISFHWCTGFLIDRMHVLTAAHCFESSRRNMGRFTVRVGSDDQFFSEEYTISDIKIHEGYKRGYFYDDVAILTLVREVNVSNFVPICLPDDRIAAKDLTGWGATIIGWGSKDFGSRIDNILKQLDDVPILANEECHQIFTDKKSSFRRHFPRGITKSMMCVGLTEGSRDACQGFSGAPAMVLYRKHWFAVGLSSFGYRCGEPGVPSGYIRISSYLDWIRQNIENGTEDWIRQNIENGTEDWIRQNIDNGTDPNITMIQPR